MISHFCARAARAAAFSSVALLATMAAADAHVTLANAVTAQNSYYKAALQVPHGCDGAATTAIRVQIPEGVIGVKPMPKPGWTLTKITGKYEKAYDNHGTPLTEGITEVAWSGGNLADDEYDEFVLRGSIAADLAIGSMLYFPIVQECADGVVERWIEIPAGDQTSDDLELPAPGIKLLEKTGGH